MLHLVVVVEFYVWCFQSGGGDGLPTTTSLWIREGCCKYLSGSGAGRLNSNFLCQTQFTHESGFCVFVVVVAVTAVERNQTTSDHRFLSAVALYFTTLFITDNLMYF